MRIIIILSLMVISTVLTGCMSSEQARAKLQAKSNQELCLEWMKYPAANVYQNLREAEIRSRAINCSQYGNVEAARAAAEQGLSDNLERLSNALVQAGGGGQSTRQFFCGTRSYQNLTVVRGGASASCPDGLYYIGDNVSRPAPTGRPRNADRQVVCRRLVNPRDLFITEAGCPAGFIFWWSRNSD